MKMKGIFSKTTPLSKGFVWCCLVFFWGALPHDLAAQTPNFNIQFRAQMRFAGEQLANICGYAQNGREYALVGGSRNTHIVEVTNPDVPVLIKSIPIVNNAWKEIKTYRNYAYIVTEGGGGLQIINLQNLPDTNIAVRYYTGDSTIAGTYNRTHALHVDTTKGFLYLFGTTGLHSGGATVLSLQDPWNPRFVGKFSTSGYVHDGYVDNDTLYAGHINDGYFTIVDFRNKANPVLLGQQSTLGTFTHNTWLTSDRKHLLTTDEIPNSYLASYDISNPRQIRLLDKTQINPNSGSVVHNTHIRGNYAITSWYRDGVAITDVSRPNNLINVGAYDTYPQGLGNGFNGAWGVYPFLPSGTLVVSNIEDGLFVLTPQYRRACYLEGTVTDSVSRLVLANVQVKINSTDLDKNAKSGNDGIYRTGQVTAGSFEVTYSLAGYYPKTIRVQLVAGQLVTQDIALVPKPRTTVSGTVFDQTTNARLANAKVRLMNENTSFEGLSDANGNFSIANVPIDSYNVVGGRWGHFHNEQRLNITNNSNITIRLLRGYQDDFWADFGWQTGGNAPRGRWERGLPIGTDFNGAACNPAIDATIDIGKECYVTGNGGGAAGDDDVDDGNVSLTSPLMSLRSFYQDPMISFQYWFFNTGGSTARNDSFKVLLSNGLRDTTIFLQLNSNSRWLASPMLNIKRFLPLTDSMKVTFYTADALPGHLLEVAVDAFKVLENPLATHHIALDWQLSAMPNPFGNTCFLQYKTTENIEKLQLKIYDVLGRLVYAQKLEGTEGGIPIESETWAKGLYFVRLENEKQVSTMLKVVKQ